MISVLILPEGGWSSNRSGSVIYSNSAVPGRNSLFAIATRTSTLPLKKDGGAMHFTEPAVISTA
jgi:hypothetical protein